MVVNKMCPFSLDERRLFNHILTEVDIAQWCEILLANIRADEDMLPWANKTWSKAKVANRGITTGSDIPGQLNNLNKMITFVATYAPAALYGEIVLRSTSLDDIWDVIYRWAGIRSSSSRHRTYYRFKKLRNDSFTRIVTRSPFPHQNKDSSPFALVPHTPYHRLVNRSPVEAEIQKIIIKRVSAFSLPIMSALHYGKIQYLLLDYYAETSLMTINKCKNLKLRVFPTNFKALRIVGVSNLIVLGECYTSFIRGKHELMFAALVVNNIGAGIDILAGANFLKINDVAFRLATSEIYIKGTMKIPITPPSVFNLEGMKPRNFPVPSIRNLKAVPKDTISINLPPDIKDEIEVTAEFYRNRVPPSFIPDLYRVINDGVEIRKIYDNPVPDKKDSQITSIRKLNVSDVPKKKTPLIFATPNLPVISSVEDVASHDTKALLQFNDYSGIHQMKKSVDRDIYIPSITEAVKAVDDGYSYSCQFREPRSTSDRNPPTLCTRKTIQLDILTSLRRPFHVPTPLRRPFYHTSSSVHSSVRQAVLSISPRMQDTFQDNVDDQDESKFVNNAQQNPASTLPVDNFANEEHNYAADDTVNYWNPVAAVFTKNLVPDEPAPIALRDNFLTQRIVTPTLSNRLVRPGQYITYIVEKDIPDQRDVWSFAKVISMAMPTIKAYPAWYTICTYKEGTSQLKCVFLCREDKGRTWDTVLEEEVP